jgi:hypothetical protein
MVEELWTGTKFKEKLGGLEHLLFSNDSQIVWFLIIGTPLSLLVGVFLGKYLLPLVQALIAFPPFLFLVARQRWSRAFLAMTLWALLGTFSVGIASYFWPAHMESTILNGPEYQGEMFNWIETGVGPEGDIQQFLPQHLLHFGVFSLLTFLSAGLLGLVMGSVLVNYMSFYVGTLLLQAEQFWAVLLMGWPPWAILRVLAFILAAVFLAALTFRYVSSVKMDIGGAKRCMAVAVALLALDILLKWSLAPIWRSLLKDFTEL